jgi:6-pyruvoyltetrahydropterin/6-carboxytetrahydropterin synthase
MKAHLHRRYHFSASHRLHSDAYDDARNREVYGKCNNPHGHGHNYVVEITLSGPVSAETGMVIDLVTLDALVQKEILDRFDHTNLNLTHDFSATVPSTENLIIRIYDLLRDRLGSATLDQVVVEETGNNTFQYAGQKEILH